MSKKTLLWIGLGLGAWWAWKKGWFGVLATSSNAINATADRTQTFVPGAQGQNPGVSPLYPLASLFSGMQSATLPADPV